MLQGAIVGAVKAGSWVPAVYARAQQASVATFYAQNNYIECAVRLYVQKSTHQIGQWNPTGLGDELLRPEHCVCCHPTRAVNEAEIIVVSHLPWRKKRDHQKSESHT